MHRQYGDNKSLNIERIKSVDFFLGKTWNRDETAKLQFEDILNGSWDFT